MKANALYIIVCQTDASLTIGYLPRSIMPKQLRAAFMKSGELHIDSFGITGIYRNKKLAEVHCRAERAWRTDDSVRIVTIWPDGE